MDQWLRAKLSELEAAGLLREPDDSRQRQRESPSGMWLDACSNDYLGLAAESVSRETLDSLVGVRIGAGAARLVQGTFDEHLELERALADWLGRESCLLTLSGFSANVGLIPALADSESLIVSDELNHASIVDGCRLARARVVATALRDHRGSSPAWVVTEGLFSMDGDSPNLTELRALCDRYGAGLAVDEAHSLGVFGPSGAGLAALLGSRADVVVAGLGKAVGVQGGLLAGSTAMTKWLWNRARSFVFSTGASPLLCRITLAQVRAARAADVARIRLQALSERLRSELAARGLPAVSGSRGPIVPVVLGSNERAMNAMHAMRARGILVQAIRPPTVPKNAARLRLTVHANWTDDAPTYLAEALQSVCA
jgi:8-amino-7-oxononanoate synthase